MAIRLKEDGECPRFTPKRAPYRGGKTAAQTKPWLKVDPPMSRSTWYRRRKEEQGK